MRVRKVDANQPEIVKAFRSLGCSVAITSSLGEGFPDLAVGKNRKTVLVEVKDGAKPPSARKLTEDEQEFFEAWKGSYEVVEDISDVHRIVRSM